LATNPLFTGIDPTKLTLSETLKKKLISISVGQKVGQIFLRYKYDKIKIIINLKLKGLEDSLLANISSPGNSLELKLTFLG
jgi:hypothetical protein